MTRPVVFTADFIYPENISAPGSYAYESRGVGDFFKLIPVKPGLFMTVYNQSMHQTPDMAFEFHNAPVVFSCVLSGSSIHQLRGFKNRKLTEFKLQPMTNYFGSISRVSGDLIFGKTDPLISVDLKIDRRLLESYLSDCMDDLPREIRQSVTSEGQYYHSGPLDRKMMATALEVVNPPPLKDKALTLFYESRALDLMSLQLDNLNRMRPFYQKISRSDIERIRHARKLLVSDLKKTPTIAALSRQCGINEFKLKKGFKQVFNSTIFSYLQKIKMDEARGLLLEGNHSVTEVASEVGYTNISHFAAAFRKHFFINPGTLKRADSATSYLE